MNFNTIVCPANQTYTTYSDRDCQTCSNWDVVDCMPKSTPDCYCDGGYVHPDNDPKECIATDDCPVPTCGENEEYKIGANCQTCSNYAVVLCLPTLEKRCVCKSGYVRHDVTGICTLIANCPVCPANQTFTNYGDRDCQTCENWQTIDCRPNDTPACYCSEGYVHIDTATKDCIATEDCPKPTCGVNEVYLHEGVAGVTCENRFYVKFAPQKVSQCYCIEHHVRNAQNVCTHVDDCP